MQINEIRGNCRVIKAKRPAHIKWESLEPFSKKIASIIAVIQQIVSKKSADNSYVFSYIFAKVRDRRHMEISFRPMRECLSNILLPRCWPHDDFSSQLVV